MKKKVLIGLLALSMVATSFQGVSLVANAEEENAQFSEAIEKQQEEQLEESREKTEQEKEFKDEIVASLQEATEESTTTGEEKTPITLTGVECSDSEITLDELGDVTFTLSTENGNFTTKTGTDASFLYIGIAKKDDSVMTSFQWSGDAIKYEGDCIKVSVKDSADFDPYSYTPGEWTVNYIYYTPDIDEEDVAQYDFAYATNSEDAMNCTFKDEIKFKIDHNIISVEDIKFKDDKTTYNVGETGTVIVTVKNNTGKDITYGNAEPGFYWADNDQSYDVCTQFMMESTETMTIPANSSVDMEIPFTVNDGTKAGEFSYYNFVFGFTLGDYFYVLGNKLLILEDGSEDFLPLDFDSAVFDKATLTVTDKAFKYDLGEGGTPATFFEDGSGKIVFEDGSNADTVIPYVDYIFLSKNAYTYNGKVQKPTVDSVQDRAYKSLVNGTDYTVSYNNATSKNVGIYGVSVDLQGSYSGNKIVEYRINPKGTAVKKVKAAKKKKFAVTWKKQAKQTTGYQIQYSKDKTFESGVKTVTVKKNKTTKKTIKAAKKGTYYVRIRTYKKFPTGNCYSTWSGAKKVKVK